MQSIYPTNIRQLMRHAIDAASGNEVFFLGRTDAEQRLAEVEVLARGNREAVPAILQSCRFGDVVIHNHPSGNLQPSSADLEIASRLGAMGVAFHIVNNSVDKLYTVVESFRPRQTRLLEPEAIMAILGPGGTIARSLPGYEERPQQQRMALAAGDAFNENRLVLVEAGTGTGKSLAYLVPAILWARNNEERVVVSTNTINLQEQLIRKDIPFLQRATGLEFRAVLVKGRSNYLCRRRLDASALEPGLFENDASSELQELQDWAAHTAEGSREELPFVPRKEVWEEVCCEADQCARVRCTHYQSCFFHRARRLAAQADLLVVNHALLLSDLALRKQTHNYTAAAVLPPFDRVIVDEAHHLEDVATTFFSTAVTRFSFARVLNRLRHPRKAEQGLLPRFLSLLARELSQEDDELYRDLYDRSEELSGAGRALSELTVSELEGIGLDLAKGRGENIPEEGELRCRVLPELTETPLWAEICGRVRHLAKETLTLAAALENLLKNSERLPQVVLEKAASPLTDLAGLVGRLMVIAGELNQFIARDPDICAWYEVRRGRVGRGTGLVTRLCTAPVEVAEQLKEALFDRFRTVVMTSATLSVEGRFDYVRQRIGLDQCEVSRQAELLLSSPFDFSSQARLVIPNDIPEPGQAGYQEMVRDLTELGILAADGRSFVLFTAYSLLRRVHAELSPGLEMRGYRCLRQGAMVRHRLLREFCDDPTSCLFATDSFWEGVDVPGQALQQVIITRLPFKVPTEPVLEARAEAIIRRGGDPFLDFTIPQAILKFKQGFGRLIRQRTDRGVVLILDARVVKKGYGRRFLRSLPEVPVSVVPQTEALATITEFFGQNGKKSVPGVTSGS